MSSATKYTVKQGECFSSIAYQHGFFWESLWSHPDNAELKRTRDTPFVLKPGDVVHIPPLNEREESCPTGKVHTFRVQGVPELLRLQLMEMDEPLADLPYVLEYGGETFPGTTDPNGVVEAYVPPDLRVATLRVGEGEEERVYELSLRTLNPAEEIDGAQARLANLGFYQGPVHGTLDDATTAALRRFQESQQLPPTGEVDRATIAALSAAHAGNNAPRLSE